MWEYASSSERDITSVSHVQKDLILKVPLMTITGRNMTKYHVLNVRKHLKCLQHLSGICTHMPNCASTADVGKGFI